MKKSKSKKMDKKTEQMFRSSEVGSLIEHLEGKFDAVAEGQTILQEELREFKDEMHEFKDEMYVFRDEMYVFKKEMYVFKDEMYIFRDEMYKFKSETTSNFKTVFEYFSNLDEEIKDIKIRLDNLEEGNMDKDNRISLMERVRNLEKEVEQFRVLLKLKKA